MVAEAIVADCIVVGGGLIGMFTARELALSGMTVTLIDRNQCGQESSWSGGGILSPLFPWRYPEPVTRLAAWSQSHFQNLTADIMQDSGIDPEWSQNGMLLVSMEDELEAERWAAQFGYEMHNLMKTELRQYEPALEKHYHRALYFPDVAQIRSPRLVKSIKKSLIVRGVEIKENTSVSKLLIDQHGISGVVTNRGQYYADKVVLCGGAWTGQLLAELELQLDVEPVRGQMLMYKARPGVVQHLLLTDNVYLIPRRDGRVLTGSTLEYVGYDKMPTEQAADMLHKNALQLVPALEKFPIEMQWTGLRPGSKNKGIPYVSEVSSMSGLYVNAGHFRNGVVLAPASAKLIADIIFQRPPIVEPSWYQVSETVT